MREEEPIEVIYQQSGENLKMGTHFHNSYEMICVATGRAVFEINRKRYEAGPGSILFINHFENHSLQVNEYPYKRYYILIQPEYLATAIGKPEIESIFRHRPDNFSHMISLSPAEQTEILALIKRIYLEYQSRQPFWQMSMDALLRSLLIRLYRSFPGHFPVTRINDSARSVLQVQKYLETHYQEEITLSGAASAFYMDRYYLSHLFRSVTGFGFKEYLNLVRLSKAKDQLFYGDESITQVALSCGFNNVSHFIRTFKEHEGITPYQYHKKFSPSADTGGENGKATEK